MKLFVYMSLLIMSISSSWLNAGALAQAYVLSCTAAPTISLEEQHCINQRLTYAVPALQNFLSSPVAAPSLPKIAVCLSGGGYRSMIASLGYMLGFEALGLLDAITYVTSLSGSTWLIAPWLTSGQSLTDYKNYLLNLIQNDHFNVTGINTLKTFGLSTLINDLLWPKISTDQALSSVDLYGALLANALMSGAQFTGGAQEQKLSAQRTCIADGSHPFPLYTAVGAWKNDAYHSYEWYEFSPYYMSNSIERLSIPTEAFGSHFENGRASHLLPEQSLGYLLGIFGSAYAINAQEIYQDYYVDFVQQAQQATSITDYFKYMAAALAVKAAAQAPQIGTLRAAPARLFSPWFNLQEFEAYAPYKWFTRKKHITLIDAGINFNLPVAPLLLPERTVDLIIIPDASAGSTELTEALAYAKKIHGVTYQLDPVLSGYGLQVYGEPSGRYPMLLYIPFMHNQELLAYALQNPTLATFITQNNLAQFDPVNCYQQAFCSTFNFGYTAAQFRQLSAFGEYTIRAAGDQLRTIINAIIAQKKSRQ
jgi:phospholipase A2